jgi:hypothetical protein
MMASPKTVHLVWNAGKDVHAGTRLVQELGPMRAVQETTKTLMKENPDMNEFDAMNMSTNVLQYQTMLAQGRMPCHATRERLKAADKRSLREKRASQQKGDQEGSVGEPV